MRLTSLVFFLALLARAAAAAPDLHFASGGSRVALIELYTSEGCSSCPPAERWLGALREDSGLWRDYVPVSFHVNYWDDLGWKDRLASRAYTDRQYLLANAWGSRSVYTPCFVRDGAEWHPGSGPPGPDAGAPGVLSVDVAGSLCRIRWAAGSPAAAGEFEVHVALLGGGLVSRVTAGENRGSTLAHEFVVLGLADHGLRSSAGETGEAELPLPAPAVPGARRLAIAAWVTRRGDLAPLQATGGWLDSGG